MNCMSHKYNPVLIGRLNNSYCHISTFKNVLITKVIRNVRAAIPRLINTPLV
jgi:hypothetical protein